MFVTIPCYRGYYGAARTPYLNMYGADQYYGNMCGPYGSAGYNYPYGPYGYGCGYGYGYRYY